MKEAVELQVELRTSTTLDTGKGGKGMLIEIGMVILTEGHSHHHLIFWRPSSIFIPSYAPYKIGAPSMTEPGKKPLVFSERFLTMFV